jgi:hypothetical protein
MAILEKFTNQPAERQDYDISFVDWLAALGDGGVSVTVAGEPGLTLLTSTLVAGVVKVWVEGGTNGTSYKVTVTLTTTGGRIKQEEIVIKVKET